MRARSAPFASTESTYPGSATISSRRARAEAVKVLDRVRAATGLR
jgi:hypothetical protein